MSVVDGTPSDQPHTAHGKAGRGFLATAVQGARRQWPLAAAAGIALGAAVGGAYFATARPKHTVSATLQVAQEELNLLGDRHGVPGEVYESYRRTQVALLRTRRVLQEAVKDPKVADTALVRGTPNVLNWLETELKVSTTDGGLVQVALTGENPEELATLLNAVVNTYLTRVVDAEKNDRLVKIDEVEKVLTTVDDRLRSQREQLRLHAEQLRMSDTQALTLKQKLALEAFNSMWLSLNTIDAELRRVKAELAVNRAKAETAKDAQSPLPEAVVAESVAADPRVKDATDRVQSARLVLEEAGKIANPTGAGLAGAKKRLADAETALDEARRVQRGVVEKRLREAATLHLGGLVRETEARVQILERQRSDLEPEVKRRELEVDRIGMGSFELEAAKDRVNETDTVAKRIRAEKERLTIEVQTHKRRVNVYSPADAGEARVSTHHLTATGGLGLAGACVGVLGVGLVEGRRRRLVQVADVTRALKLRTIGTVPLSPGLAAGQILDLWEGRQGLIGSVVVEAVNDLRTILLCGGLPAHPKVVQLTSAVQGEGKTTLACLLALGVAQTGKRTLLIDGDLRNPRVHEKFGLPRGPGLGEVLRGEARVSKVVHIIPGTNLAVLPAGQLSPTLIRALTSDRLRDLLAPLRPKCDMILIDSCPVLPVSDGLVMSKAVDAVLLVIRSGLSSETLVRDACHRLEAVNAPVAGGIVNGLSMTRSGLRYPYEYLSLAPAAAAAAAPSGPAGPATARP